MIRTVHFLEIDTHDDFLVSFWLDERGERHVTVMRLREGPDRPAEELPPPALFTHDEPKPRFDRLVAAEWDAQRVWLKSDHREFTLDISRAENVRTCIPYAHEALRRMNHDRSFDLTLRRGPRKATKER